MPTEMGGRDNTWPDVTELRELWKNKKSNTLLCIELLLKLKYVTFFYQINTEHTGISLTLSNSSSRIEWSVAHSFCCSCFHLDTWFAPSDPPPPSKGRNATQWAILLITFISLLSTYCSTHFSSTLCNEMTSETHTTAVCRTDHLTTSFCSPIRQNKRTTEL